MNSTPDQDKTNNDNSKLSKDNSKSRTKKSIFKKIVVDDVIDRRIRVNSFYRTYAPDYDKLTFLESDYHKMKRLIENHNASQ